MPSVPDPIDHAFILAATLRSGVCRARIESETLAGVATVIQTLVGEYVEFESNANVTRLRDHIGIDIETLVGHIDALGAAYHGTPLAGDAYLTIAADLDDLALACAQIRQRPQPESNDAPPPGNVGPVANDG